MTYAEFWPYYLREHSKPATRYIHCVGTLGGLACLAAAIATRKWAIFIPSGLVLGYGFAWVSHFLVEKNRPATFKYPLFSLVSDFKMLGLFLTGRLGPEVEAALGETTHS